MPPDPTTAPLEHQLDDLRWLHALARQLTRDPHAAADAVQETCVRALRQARSDREPPTAPRAWLATVLRHLLGRQHRSEAARRQREAAVAGRPHDEPEGPTVLARAETQHRLAAAVLQLDEPYRTAVLLRFFDALPPRQIARRLGVPVATVHSRLQRALAQLRQHLDQTPGGRAQWLHALAPFAVPTSLLPWPGLGVFTMQLHLKLLTVAAVFACSVPFWWPSGTMEPAEPSLAALPNGGADRDLGSGGGAANRANPARSAGPVERTAAARSESTAPAAATATSAVAGRVVDCRGVGATDVPIAPNGQADRAVRSDPAGNFTLELTAATTSIGACDPRFVTVLAASWSPDSRLTPVVVVAPALTLAGRAVDELGAPVPGALVAVQLPADFETRVPMPLDGGERGRWTTACDAAGRFTLPSVPGIDGATLIAAADLFAPTTVPLPTTAAADLQLVLQRCRYEEGELRGRVVDPGGVPVAGARVAMGVTSVVSDQDGRFGISLRRAGWPTAIVAAKAGFGPARLEVPKNGGKQLGDWPNELVLRLGAAPQTVRGRVLDQDRRPIAGAEVWIDDPTPFGVAGRIPLQLEYLVGGGVVPRGASQPVPEADDPTTGDHVSTQLSKARTATAAWFFVTSDQDGNFAVPGLLDRSYTLKALDPTSGQLGELTGVTAAADATIEITRRDVWPELRGRIVSRGGKALAGVTVQQQITAFATAARVPGGHLRGGVLRDGRTATTAADGTFVMRDVGRRSTYFEIVGDAIVPQRLEAADITDPLRCTVTVEARCHVEVALLDATEADAVAGLDANGQPIQLAVLRRNSTTFTSQLPLHDGRSGLFVVGESAAALVLQRGDRPGRRIPISPDPTRTTTVR